MTQRVMVAYATKYGSTAEIAEVVAATLRNEGIDAEAAPASKVTDIGPYSAVILGSALYMGRWLRDARRFVRRHQRALRERAVWVFSSGPLDPSASERDIGPVPSAGRAMCRIHAREHVTFGGRLEAGAKGRVARMILEEDRGGDFRDFDAITTWATATAAEIKALREGS
ncbi:flavodoxin domain-containing protein [Streptomyces sp. NBC_01341]|uniref:flavodoxin domain-containing protein n=1 Tax=Streptomyces sp. NBC_01341 TaxID=2903831 RepID=UPI002E1042BD|nr:flavodoxin domain-containing protein [Streptomyces sp. NBC_01341]